MPCDSIARNSALIPMVSHALPRMQWALTGAKRLECGSLLSLCFYAQPTCLEPDRHDAANNVSVPISAAEGFFRKLRQPPIGTRGDLLDTLQAGVKTQTTSLSPYLGLHPNNEPGTLIVFLFNVLGRRAGCTESIHLPAHSVSKGESGRFASILFPVLMWYLLTMVPYGANMFMLRTVCRVRKRKPRVRWRVPSKEGMDGRAAIRELELFWRLR